MSTLHDAQPNGHIASLLAHSYKRPSDLIIASLAAPAITAPATKHVPLASEHTIKLSSIEHCMPRAYIRVCLAYRISQPEDLSDALEKLKAFVRRSVDRKPYLAGYVVPAKDAGRQVGKVEVQFTNQDWENFDALQIRRYTPEEMPFTYDELDQQGLPPSIIKPELVSELAEGADEKKAPVLRVQANIIEGGVIVSFYLHHCVSDGYGLGLLISGSVLETDYMTFERHLDADGHPPPSLTERLATFANMKTCARTEWSWSSPNQIHTRHIAHKFITPATCVSDPTKLPGRGCIFTFPCEILQQTKASLKNLLTAAQRATLEDFNSNLSLNDVLQALLWHYMSRARIPSLEPIYAVQTSKLLIPVDIRSKLKPQLSFHYFGSAVDFAAVELPLELLSETDDASLSSTAFEIRQAILKVDDPYIRSSIALATSSDPDIDVRDLLASNMNRVTGADMYITSWARLPFYTSELDMGLGPPDWVRKPESKDPGSCIVLPQDGRKDYLEVVVQMTKADMERLLTDQQFMKYVSRVIE